MTLIGSLQPILETVPGTFLLNYLGRLTSSSLYSYLVTKTNGISLTQHANMARFCLEREVGWSNLLLYCSNLDQVFINL